MRSISIEMAPSRASSTTSASSERVPQLAKVTEVTSGTPPQLIGVQAGRLQRGVGAAAGRDLEGLVATVHGHHARRAERLQQLDGDVAEPTDADDDRARSRSQQA